MADGRWLMVDGRWLMVLCNVAILGFPPLLVLNEKKTHGTLPLSSFIIRQGEKT